MAAQPSPTLIASCRCGAVAFEAVGAPILTVTCYCKSCQAAAGAIGGPILRPDGGTDFIMHRKDRIRCVTGGERLVEHRLKPDAGSRRMLAGCCNAPMYLEFAGGHWLSVYRDRLDAAPPVEMRVMTDGRREGVELPNDIPSYATHSARFMWRLLCAWAAMGFRVPKVEGTRA